MWVFPVSCRNVGVFSPAIRLVAREPNPLAVFSLHFLISGLNFVPPLCSESHGSFLIVVKKNDLTYYMDTQ